MLLYADKFAFSKTPHFHMTILINRFGKDLRGQNSRAVARSIIPRILETLANDAAKKSRKASDVINIPHISDANDLYVGAAHKQT